MAGVPDAGEPTADPGIYGMAARVRSLFCDQRRQCYPATRCSGLNTGGSARAPTERTRRSLAVNVCSTQHDSSVVPPKQRYSRRANSRALLMRQLLNGRAGRCPRRGDQVCTVPSYISSLSEKGRTWFDKNTWSCGVSGLWGTWADRGIGVNRLIMTSGDTRRDGTGRPRPIVHNSLSDDKEGYIIWPMWRFDEANRHPRYGYSGLCHHTIADSSQPPEGELPGFGGR
jgi:hypothetical protein